MSSDDSRAGAPRRLQTLLVSFLMLFCFTAGAYLDRFNLLPGWSTHEPLSARKTSGVFWQAWNLVEKEYVDRKAVDPRKMTYGAIEGMIHSLGDVDQSGKVDHSQFLPPAELKIVESDLKGHFTGIGTEVSLKNGKPTVIAALEGSPAAKAGVKAGDVLIKVDGKDLATLPLDRVVELVRGREGTSVHLTLLREGQAKLVDVTIVRADLKISSVKWSRLPGLPLAYLAIHDFNENTTDQLIVALKEILASRPQGLVLDLRNNPGGIRDQAVSATSQFLRSGNVLSERDGKGRIKEYPVKPGGLAVRIPMVVVINQGTASAGEIMAGALQDQRRAALIGKTSFGAGTVLQPYRLIDGSALLLAVSEWLTPNGRSIWRQGVKPDIDVDLPTPTPADVPLTSEAVRALTPEGLKTTRDTQLKRAIEELQRRTETVQRA